MKKVNKLPLKKENIDWSNVINRAEDHVLELWESGIIEEDDEHYIFEEVMVAIYGKDIWKKYNKKIQ